MKIHPDEKWINDRSGDCGACYSLDNIKPSKIDYICYKPIVYIWLLNLILYFRWIKRRAIKWFNKNITIGGIK